MRWEAGRGTSKERRGIAAAAPGALRRRGVTLLLLTLLLPGLACAQPVQGGQDPEAALRAGRYEEAVSLGRQALARDPADGRARRALVGALAETGRYEEAEEAAGELTLLRGEMLLARGRRAEAEAAFREAVERGGPDRLGAELHLATLLFYRGERDEALRRFDRFIDVYNASGSLTAAELVAVGTAVRYLGERDPALFRDAVKAYDEAAAADPADPEARLRLGELFLEKYNGPDAHAAFREVLAANPSHPRALLGLARARHFDGESAEAFGLVRRSLEVNPKLVPARVFLARLQLGGEDPRVAEAEVRRALETDPTSLEALSLLAAVRWVQGDRAGFEEVRRRVHALNPTYAGLHTTVAEVASQHRRYAEAVSLAEEAVRLDPRSWAAYGVLGLNQFRVGRVEEARRALEQSFRGDPFNAWIKNHLDLLDTFSAYRVLETPHFEFLLHGDEAELLFPFAAALAEEAYESLTRRYGYRPTERIRVEFYPRHADFSVRTVGMTGLGALGVSFGRVLAMDSPAARQSGTFNWGSTLWHELAHAITLGLSDHRVPRWLTEGLSVLEERRARPGWGSETTPAFLGAYLQGELPPVSRLNEGFTRPPTPEHLGHAYHLASLVAEWIEETRGFEALPRMLRGYAEGRGTAEVLRSVLRAEPEAVDGEFDAWLRGRYPPARLAQFTTLYAEGTRLLAADRPDDALRPLAAAAALLPGGGEGSPHALLAAIHQRRGDDRAAAEALAALTALDENAYAENLRLAELLERLGDRAGAAAALDRAIYIFPYEMPVHGRLAELYAGLGERERAVRQRRAVIALRPVDEAGARYQLARALLDAGDRAGARREVLRALEAAPSFEQAQELLLRLRDAS
jgi:cellulose synthase operon protein C